MSSCRACHCLLRHATAPRGKRLKLCLHAPCAVLQRVLTPVLSAATPPPSEGLPGSSTGAAGQPAPAPPAGGSDSLRKAAPVASSSAPAAAQLKPKASQVDERQQQQSLTMEREALPPSQQRAAAQPPAFATPAPLVVTSSPQPSPRAPLEDPYFGKVRWPEAAMICKRFTSMEAKLPSATMLQSGVRGLYAPRPARLHSRALIKLCTAAAVCARSRCSPSSQASWTTCTARRAASWPRRGSAQPLRSTSLPWRRATHSPSQPT